MFSPKSSLFFIGCSTIFLSSCALKKKPDLELPKKSQEYVNPYEPGTYEHFKADKKYPKTHNIWKNEVLLAQTNEANSWIRINLSSQRGFLMKGDEVVVDYPISSGTKTHPTPPDEYKILEKIVDKSSNKYGRMYDAEGNMINGDANAFEDKVPEGGKFVGAPMSYWMRLTWTGVGHHVGPIPLYPASHGCIRGARAAMPIVFEKVKVGTKVIVR